MKPRFNLKYQLFFNESTGIATCRLLGITLAKWINDDNMSLDHQSLLIGAINTVCFRYRRKGWPETHAKPSSKAKIDSKFGLALAKKRLIHRVLCELSDVIDEDINKRYNDLHSGIVLAGILRDYADKIYMDKHGMYAEAAKREGDEGYDDPDLSPLSKSISDAATANGEPRKAKEE